VHYDTSTYLLEQNKIVISPPYSSIHMFVLYSVALF